MKKGVLFYLFIIIVYGRIFFDLIYFLGMSVGVKKYSVFCASCAERFVSYDENCIVHSQNFVSILDSEIDDKSANHWCFRCNQVSIYLLLRYIKYAVFFFQEMLSSKFAQIQNKIAQTQKKLLKFLTFVLCSKKKAKTLCSKFAQNQI